MAKIGQAVGVLEKMLSGSTVESAMSKKYDPQVDRILSKPYTGGYYVEGSYSYIAIGQVRQILIEVRSRLLDFILELREEFGTTVPEEDIRAMATKLDVSGIFNRSVFGDNTTILVGSHNHQQVTNTTVKNDKGALVEELRKHKVSQADIDALTTALDEDQVPTVAGQVGPAVDGWMRHMVGKAINNSWDVSIGAAGSLLATAIQKYYGF